MNDTDVELLPPPPKSLTPMNHPHWIIQGKSQVHILAVPDRESIGKETEEFTIHIRNRPGLSSSHEGDVGDQAEETYQCEIRGEDDISIYKANGMSRKLISTGKIHQKNREISFSTGEVWLPVIEIAKPKPPSPPPLPSSPLQPSTASVHSAGHPENSVPPLPQPPAAANLYPLCQPCPQLEGFGLPPSPTKRRPDCKPVPCIPPPPPPPCPACPKPANTWMYVAIALMVAIGLFLLKQFWNFSRKRAGRSHGYDSGGSGGSTGTLGTVESSPTKLSQFTRSP